MWDIEARMTDRKGYAVQLLIHAVNACIDAAPHRICPSVTPNFQCLVGLRIAAGFGAELRRRLGGVHGCTHLVELFGPLATTAIQTVHPLRRGLPEADHASRPVQIDTCYALASNGEVVAKYWPRFYTRTDQQAIAERSPDGA
jgi:hypothetical protein